MSKLVKILVLNDDSLPALTVYDAVFQRGFKYLNRPITKAHYQTHPSYNELLNESSELSKRFFFEPSDFYAPIVKIDADDESDIPKNTPRVEGLDKWLTEVGMRHLLAQPLGQVEKESAAKSVDFSNEESEPNKETLELSALIQAINQGEPNLRPLGNGLEWLNTHVDRNNQNDMPEATRKANLHLVEYVDTKEEPLESTDFSWFDQTVFFTLDDYTNVDTKFIAQNFDGVFFVCHAPLGSKVLPEALMSILTECQGSQDCQDSKGSKGSNDTQNQSGKDKETNDKESKKLGLWLFNLKVEAKPMINALNLKKGDFNFQLMQSLQSTEFQQLQVFLDKLIPCAEFAGCLNSLDYEALAAYYVYGQDASTKLPNLQLSHNVYQSLHYLKQVKSLCNTGFGLGSMWQQSCALSAKPKLHGITESANDTLPNTQGMGGSLDSSQAVAKSISDPLKEGASPVARATTATAVTANTTANATNNSNSDKAISPLQNTAVSARAALAKRRVMPKAVSALEDPKFKECTVEQFPNRLFGCPFNKLSDWKFNTLPTEQNGDAYVPHILISSKYFNFSPILGMELMGARLLVQILASFPEVNISLVFNQCVYSWLADLPKDTILWQEQGELTTHDAFIESAKATHDLMSTVMRTRVMADLRRHILATLNDQATWQWTVEQRHNLESLVVKFDSPSAGKIFCYPRLTEAVLNLNPDVVISDVHSDLVRAKSKGVAAIELVESPNQWDGLAQFTRDKTYFENLANSSNIEQSAILRFSMDRIFNVQKARTLQCSKQSSNKVRNDLLLRGLAQNILSSSEQNGGAAINLDKSRVYKNTKLLPSNCGFSSGYKLAWTDVLHKLDWLNHVYAEESLSEQIETCYNEHVSLVRTIGKTLQQYLELKVKAEETGKDNAPQFKRAQLSNFTCAKRYYPQHFGLSYLAALAHSQGYGDGATLISKVGQFELAEVWQEQLKHLIKKAESDSSISSSKSSSSSSSSKPQHQQPASAQDQTKAKAPSEPTEPTEPKEPKVATSYALNLERTSEQLYAEAVNQAGKQAVSELTQQFIRQGAQWPVFKPLSLSVLSFGCSRGDEIFDLLPLFNGQRFTGIDINEGAIKVAQQQLMNLPEVKLEDAPKAFAELYALSGQVLEENEENSAELQKSLQEVKSKLSDCYHMGDSQGQKQKHDQNKESASGVGAVNKAKHSKSVDSKESIEHSSEVEEALRPRLVQYLGAMGLVNFASSKEFFAQYENQPLPQFDVVTAMTVLCRHPETMFLLNSKEVYPFEEFMDTLNLLDRMVKPGGLLCIFNSNYLLEDSPLADKYIGVYPFKLPAQDSIEQGESLGCNLAEVAQRCFAEHISQPSSSTSTTKQAKQHVLSQSGEHIAPIPLPRAYAELYRERGIFEKGHVALFNPDGSLCAQRREEAMIIYYKKPV